MERASRLSLDAFIPTELALAALLPSSMTLCSAPATFPDAPATARTAASPALHPSPCRTATV